ncbi:phospholipase B [Spathaspora passalidarum NRRL Y-27907]|uniref:Lysophospholipase n=1 Tax=Spathaspora passalidarum (strain NRRL Y-27907 / 11-Y1) TaxID=619300 RepID=G3AU51_SPAPN|nr:phospholipase B [Spathaspora passalidarum NRRL Y-27907]EGW30427.1 phospholipase B [Spathaspora passalidarum NRRL Y-27907]
MYLIPQILLLLQVVLATSPTNDYAPGSVSCPGGSLTRAATGINTQEENYITNRNPITKSALGTFLSNAGLTDFDVSSFLSQAQPSIGLAFSGGGYRAMLTGAGELAALDSRTWSKDKTLAGILQASSYITGLSGGSWLVGSVASNDNLSIDQILADGNLWNIQSILDYYGINVIGDTVMWSHIADQVNDKSNAGFETSITDPWGRALSYQLLTNFDDKGDAVLWSDITSSSAFSTFQMPFPILVADGRAPGTSIINLNSTVFELTPYELGSWDPSLKSFVQTKYLGTTLDNGQATGQCYNGYDNAGFFMGTSSSLFNEALLSLNQSGLPSFITDLINKYVVDPIENSNVDVADYNPNPFYKSTNQDTTISKASVLNLVDGGEDGQNIPIVPLLNRNVDVIFAHDNSDNINSWPDGSSLINTFERQFVQQGENVAFPYVPDQKTFRNLNLTSKPVFFGCDAQNLTSLTDDIYDVPLVIYLPNRPFTYWSNTSTFKLDYSDTERNGMIQNGYEISTRKNGTLDSEWAACVGCAIIRREQERLGQSQTPQCQQCFTNYCWDGTIYEGADLGDNYSDDGLTKSATYYNSKNVAGFDDGATNLFK